MKYARKCPECNIIINYSNKYTLASAEKKQSKCQTCRSKPENNGFYGKKHSQQTIQYLSILKKGRKLPEEQKKRLSEYNKNKKTHWMRDMSASEKLIEKYGIEEGSKRIAHMKNKISLASKGKNNPMYGKPTPKKAGNGWCGWYNNHFFRSLRELSYIIKYLENKNWKTAENIRIPYINYDGSERTYSPDFIIDDNHIIEIKPSKLINSPLNKLKSNAALKYCQKNNMRYSIFDVEILSISEIKKLVNNHTIKFTEKTKEKYNQWLLNNKETI